MELATCILCDNPSSAVVLAQRDINLGLDKEHTFTLVRCEACGLIYLNPRPTPAEIKAYYPPEYYPTTLPGERKAVDRIAKRVSGLLKKGIREEFYGYEGVKQAGFVRQLRRLALYPEYWHLRFVGRDIIPFRGEGRLLDVGCGSGKLLRNLREQGWDTHGIDFSPVAVENALSAGLNVKLGDLFDASFKDGFFDVVVFSHSLEHMYDPLETLKEAHRIMKPGGLLLIYIPNAGSFEAWVFGKWWVAWDVPRHLYHFNKKTMSQLVVKAGFQLVMIKDGLGKSSFLGSLDHVYRHVIGINVRHGSIMRHVAGPICLILGHLGFGSEMKVYAEKPQ